MPASMPLITAGDTARNHWPSLHRPATSWIKPAKRTMTPIICRPNWSTSCQTSTERPAAGPLTCSGAPEIMPTMMPPTMPVMMPAVGGMPEASEMPMHSGSATRKTTIDARKSRPKVAFEYDALIRLPSARYMPSPAEGTVTVDCKTISAVPQRGGTIDLELQPGKLGLAPGPNDG